MSDKAGKYIYVCNNQIYLTKAHLQPTGPSPKGKPRLGLITRIVESKEPIELCKIRDGQIYAALISEETVKEEGLTRFDHLIHEVTTETFFAIKMLEVHSMLARALSDEGESEGYDRKTMIAIAGNIERIVN